MPTRGSAQVDWLLDTSASVPLLLDGHEHHAQTVRAVAGRRLGLSGHAAFETFSVLTRMPPPARGTPADIARSIASMFPATRHLSREAASAHVHRMAEAGISGGAVYDALVGATAVEHDLPLLTNDRRALETYRALGVLVELVEDR